MVAVDFQALSNNLEDYCALAAHDAETVVVTRKDDESIVMMGLEAYNNLMENIYIMSNQANYRHILKGIRQIENGHTVAKTTADLERLANE